MRRMQRRTLAMPLVMLICAAALGAFGAPPAAAWTIQPSGTSASINCVTFADPLHGWAGTSTGDVLRTTDGGQEWVAVSLPIAETHAVADLTSLDGLHVWAIGTRHYGNGNSDGFMARSSDGGVTWSVSDYQASGSPGGIALCDLLNGWVVSSYGFCYETTDGGMTWTSSGGGYGNGDIVVLPDGTAIVVGDLLELVPTGWPDEYMYEEWENDIAAAWRFGAAQPWQTAGVQRGPRLFAVEEVSGELWAAGGALLALAGGYGGPEYGWEVTATASVMHSTDNGQTWSVAASSESSGSVGGEPWHTSLVPETRALSGISFADSAHGWAVGYLENLGSGLVTTDGGATWTEFDPGGAPALNAVCALRSGDVWVVGPGGLILHDQVAVPPDTTTPITRLVSPLAAGWQGPPGVTLRFRASDESGVAETQYRIDGGAWTTGAAVTLRTRGLRPAKRCRRLTMDSRVFAVEYRSIDNAGNTEAPQSCEVKLDGRGPVTIDDAPVAPQKVAVVVHLTATDADSGVAQTWCRLDGGALTKGVSVSVAAPKNGSNDGTHTIAYYSVDNVGLVEPLRTCTVVIAVK